MKSWILIASYLWKDTWKRWFEQPGSPAARSCVTVLLTGVAAVILVAFNLLERNLRERLESFGLNTLLVRETLAPESPYLLVDQEGPDFLASLGAFGKKLRVRQLFAQAQSEWDTTLPVMTYPPSALPAFAEFLNPDTPFLCLSDRFPAGTYLQVRLHQRTCLACVCPPHGWVRLLVNGDLLLVPQGTFPEEERMGCVALTLYERNPSSPPIADTIAAINALYANDHRELPQIQSALPMIRDWELLKKRQMQWRRLLAAMLGGVIAMVYGAVAVLEFRQTLYVSALLRSFGTSRLFLYGRHWLENALLANSSAFAGLVLVGMLHSSIFANLGIAAGALQSAALEAYLSFESLILICCVNLGVWLSSVPIAMALRREVGSILS